jgi:hypothetical protein
LTRWIFIHQSHTRIPDACRPSTYRHVVADYEPRGVGDERRCVRVTVRKKNLGMMTHWWRRATKRGAESPVEALKTRKPGKGEESHRVWEEAQAMFKEKVAARRPPVMIDRETGEVVSPED